MISIDRLKEMALEDIENNPEKHLEEYTELVQQLDQLKAENEIYKKMLEDEDVQLALTEIRSGERHLWFNKAEKYKQTLQEIKKIVSGCLMSATRQKILQKISEVEDV